MPESEKNKPIGWLTMPLVFQGLAVTLSVLIPMTIMMSGLKATVEVHTSQIEEIKAKAKLTDEAFMKRSEKIDFKLDGIDGKFDKLSEKIDLLLEKKDK